MTSSGELLGFAKEMRRAMTPAEAALWGLLRNRQIEGVKFRRQHPFGRFVLDFFAVELRLVIEVDGEVHLQPDQQAYDLWRDDTLLALGLTVLRFSNDEVMRNPAAVINRIGQAIQHQRANLAPLPLGEGLG